ncbi:PilT/PilU family type 4a pilus ATPase [Aeromonas encheleia]|uniref:PilT/PilU family type 4a pilus ATPase n=1 Tax=Aeromonas encheleia TaxID=73010 RepID=UPI001F576E6B|nr:PilT/PilU family type 4a pilus ATPase [Aeromonas encheleia]UNP88081.1 PilT/PilU family type 4a pilus ATPase [Aeromonas encheleia]
MNMDVLLAELVAQKGSDLFITVDAPPTLKVNGRLVSLGDKPLDRPAALALVRESLDAEHFERYLHSREANYAIHREALGRFRVSAFWQQDLPGMVLRRIETHIPSFGELVLPPILQEVAMAKRGLVLFVGATGAGKSTTQAAMIGYRNQHGDGHILTVEDPVEFVHQHGRCLITQREVGIDTESFDVALKNSMRQAPDVILIGEIRNQETMELAIQFAETGHLCLATLHANNANQALDRILHLVPEAKHRQFLFDLSFNLRAIVAQQLLPCTDGSRRVAAFEILLNTPLITDIIRKGELHRLKEVMTKSSELGMQTFDQALFALFCAGQIGYSEALAHADSANDLRLLIKLSGREQLGAGSLDNVTLDE